MKYSHQLVSQSACQRRGEERNAQDIRRGAAPHRSFLRSRYAPTKLGSLFVLANCLLFSLVFAGCVPATVPPQLDATPGPAVVVTDQEYDAGAFKVRYPAGWRVISSAATSTATVLFAAPDHTAIMLFGVDAVEAPMPETDGQIRTEIRQISLEQNVSVTAILNAPAENWEVFAPLFEQSVASVK